MTSLSRLLKYDLERVFNERAARKRYAMLEDLWSKEGVLTTTEGIFSGLLAIDTAVSSLQRRYPEYEFYPAGDADLLPHCARLTWAFGMDPLHPAFWGADVAWVSGGRIVSLTRFSDGAAF